MRWWGNEEIIKWVNDVKCKKSNVKCEDEKKRKGDGVKKSKNQKIERSNRGKLIKYVNEEMKSLTYND